MDWDTAVLLALTAMAYGWFVSIGIFEERKENKARERAQVEDRKRVRRLLKLYGRD